MDKVKKVFGIVNKTVNKTVDNLRPFPEFNAMDTALQDASSNSIKYTSLLAESNGHLYTEFANKQALTVCEVLTDVQKQQSERQTVIQSNTEAYRNLRTGLQRIQPLNAGMRERKKHLKELKSKAQRMQKNHETASAKWSRANIKNPSSQDTRKLKDELDRALQKKEDAESELERFMNNFVVESKTYKKEIFATMLNIMIDFSEKFEETCDAQLPIVQEISRYGALVPEYTDSGIQQIQEELDSLRASS